MQLKLGDRVAFSREHLQEIIYGTVVNISEIRFVVVWNDTIFAPSSIPHGDTDGLAVVCQKT